MKKISELTVDQLKLLANKKTEWLKIGFSTDPVDFEKAKYLVGKCYECVGLKKPQYFYFFDSPLSAALGWLILSKVEYQAEEQAGEQVREQVSPQIMDQVRDQASPQVIGQVIFQVRKQVLDQVWEQVILQVRNQVVDEVFDQVGKQVRKQVLDQVGEQVLDQVGEQVREQVYNMAYGCHDAFWLSFYDAFLEIGVKNIDSIKGLIELSKECGWFSPYKNSVILQNRPSILNFDSQKILHCENGPAIQYRDGFSVYAWHGVRIPAEWIDDKSLTAEKALKVENAEQRRCACEIVGWNNILNELSAEIIDKNENPFVGELVEVIIPEIGKEKFLRVKCGTEREFALPVPPEIQRASQAQAWLNFTTEDMYLPKLRT